MARKEKAPKPKKEKAPKAKKQKKEKAPKLTQIKSTQSFSPVKDVQNGIIITKDGDYVKIMEFSPINFLLRSAEEQANIIAEFAAAIKIMPVSVQFKVLTSRADTSVHINNIKRHIDEEDNQKCRQLQYGLIHLIESVGNRQGVSRRFFLIFKYEQQYGMMERPSFGEIKAQLDSMTLMIQQMMLACGNEVVSRDNDDEYTLKVLYSIMCKRESSQTSFTERLKAVYQRSLAENPPDATDVFIPVNDLICPKVINTMANPNFVIIDDVYYSYFYIPSASYPTHVTGGWLSPFINFGEGVDIDFFFHKEPTGSTQTKLLYKMRMDKVSLSGADDTNLDYEDKVSTLQSGRYLKESLAAGAEFCYMATLITVTGNSREEMEWKCNELKNMCVSMNIKIKALTRQMEDALLMSLPTCSIDKNIFRKARRNIISTSLASAYPFISFEISDNNGDLLGINRANNSLVFLDQFDSSKYNNANMAILGMSGSGKTYTLMSLALRMRERGNQVFIIAPEKGYEFKRACTAIGGEYILMTAGSEHNINVMEIRKMDSKTNELLDGESGSNASILSSKVQQLHTFFSLLIPDMNYEERQLLDEALINTYGKFGITNDNESLEDPVTGEYKTMPILGDLHEELTGMGEPARRLRNILTRYVTGSASSFNRQTNVNLDNKYVVIDVSTSSPEMLPIAMYIALDYVWDKIREDRTKNKAVFIDELWKLIGAGSSKEAADFVLKIFKVIRGYAGAAIGATQDLNDFFALDGGTYGKGIINNSAIKIMMKLDQEEATRVKDTLKLTSQEIKQISRFKRGDGLLAVNTNHVLVEFVASRAENELITTDAAQLREIAARKER